jgi:hypothetical protein
MGAQTFPPTGRDCAKDSCLEYHNFLKNYQSKKIEKIRDERQIHL